MHESAGFRDAAVSIAAASSSGVHAAPFKPDAFPPAHDGKSTKLWRLAVVGALVATPAAMQMLGLPVLSGKWATWSHRMSRSIHYHIQALHARRGQHAATLRRVAAALAPLCAPVLLTCKAIGKLLLWRALLRPETWLTFKLRHHSGKQRPLPPAEPQSDVHECFTLISAAVAESPQRTHSGASSRLGEGLVGVGSSDSDSDCVDAMLQFASIGVAEPEPTPWWQIPDDDD